MAAALFPPQRVHESLVPRNMSASSAGGGCFVFDFGQNFAGWLRVRVRGRAGTTIRLRHAEVLSPGTGRLNRANLQTARAEDFYTLRGGGEEEVYEPRFTYHGFRYAEVCNWPGVPTLDAVRGRVVRAGAAAGSLLFPASTGAGVLLNKIAHAVTWTEVSNLHTIPTSCENRDERTGWTGDNRLAMEGAMTNFDTAAMYTKWLQDFLDLQDGDGTLPDVVPYAGPGPGHRPSDPAWAATFVALAWRVYRFYGDRRALGRAYAGLKRYMGWLREDTAARGGIANMRSYYGDWVSMEGTPGALVSAAYYHRDLILMSNITKVLGTATAGTSTSTSTSGKTAAAPPSAPASAPAPETAAWWVQEAAAWEAEAASTKADFNAAFLHECSSMGLYQGSHWYGGANLNSNSNRNRRGNSHDNSHDRGSSSSGRGINNNGYTRGRQRHAASGGDGGTGSGGGWHSGLGYGGVGAGTRQGQGQGQGHGGAVGPDTQGANALAVAMGLTPDEGNRTWGSVYRSALSHLGHSVQYAHDTHSSAGMYGLRATYAALLRGGDAQLAFEMLLSTTYPSYGSMVEAGATTLWELWSNKVGDSMNSHNHMMYSFIGPWMLRALAGISLPSDSQAAPGQPPRYPAPAWGEVVFKPMVTNDAPRLPHAAAAIDTHRGRVALSWWLTKQPAIEVNMGPSSSSGGCGGAGAGANSACFLDRDFVHMRVSVPVNARGTVFVPVPQNGDMVTLLVKEVMEGVLVWRNQKFQEGASGVQSAALAPPGEYAGGAIKMEVGSGDYYFLLSAEV